MAPTWATEVAPPILSPLPIPRSASTGLGAALGLLAIYVVVLVGLQVADTVLAMVQERPPAGAWLVAGQMTFAFALTLLLMPKIAKLHWRDSLSFWTVNARWIPGAGLLVLGAWGIALELGVLTESLIPMPDFIAQEFERLFADSGTLGSLVMIVLLPPLVEEALCRGFVLRAMLRKWRPAAAIVASALIFGAMHLNPWQFFYATWLGLVIGWVFWRTRSLGLCVLMHAGNNLLSWWVIRSEVEWLGGGRDLSETRPVHLSPSLILAALVLVGIGLLWLRRLTCQSRPASSAGV